MLGKIISEMPTLQMSSKNAPCHMTHGFTLEHVERHKQGVAHVLASALSLHEAWHMCSVIEAWHMCSVVSLRRGTRALSYH